MKKTNTLFLVLTILLLASSCFPSAFAQQDPGPPLQETMDWIKGKLLDVTAPSCLNGNFAAVDKTTSVSVSGSILKFTETTKDESGRYVEQVNGMQYTINFADIDPNSIKVKESTNCGGHGYSVSLETSSGDKKIRLEFLESTKLIPLSSVGLTAADEDLAERLAKAVKHAVILSGGKAGPF